MRACAGARATLSPSVPSTTTTQIAKLGDRSLFPSLRARAYLNHAAVSPPSQAVLDACQACLVDYASRGLVASIEQRAMREALRGKVARLIGATAEEIGFVQNTTAGVIAIARSIPFQRGDRVVLFAGEFPANVTPWQLVARDLELELVFVPIEPFARSTEEGLTALDDALASGARLVAVSAVQFQSGLRMPVAEIAERAHRHGAELFVDAIQALGAVPLNVVESGIDYLSAGGHKFLMGLEGAGVLYIRKQAMEALKLGLAGWTAHVDGFRFLMEGEGHLRTDRAILRQPSFVEQGSLSAPGYAALDASLDLILSLGVELIFAHVTAYLDALEPHLLGLGCTSVRATETARRSASLSVKLPAGTDLPGVARAMNRAGIAVSTPDGCLRFAPHWPNALDEVDDVARALEAALQGV